MKKRPPLGDVTSPKSSEKEERRAGRLGAGMVGTEALYNSRTEMKRSSVFSPDKDLINVQKHYLDLLNTEVGKTAETFEAAQRAREAHQRALNEMTEETLRQIAMTHGHGHQKCKYVRGSTMSYRAHFDHELNNLTGEFKMEQDKRCLKVEEQFDVFDASMNKLEADLEAQRIERARLIEEQLGPIRDEEKRILAAMEAERRARKLEDEVRTKMLQDEVEAITVMIDKEKFAREQQSLAFERLATASQHAQEKRQYQIEKERTETVKIIKESIEEEARERIEKQQGVVEAIANFVKRYQLQVRKELVIQNATIKANETMKQKHW